MSFTDPAPGATEGRTDEGVDWSGVKEIVAVAAGKITQVYQGLSGFGTTVIERLQSGQYIYYAEETSGTTTSVQPGESVRAGQEIAGGGSGGGIEVGFWDPATGRAVAAPGYQEGQPTAEGSKFRSMLSAGGGSGGGPTVSGDPTWAVKVSLESASSGSGWTELSTNGYGSPGGQSCCPSASNCFCDFAALGQAYPLGTMARITNPKTGRSGLWPMTDKGDGSSFSPAIGLTPAVYRMLGVNSGDTVHISLPGKNLQVAPGFGTQVSGSSTPAGSGGATGRARPAGATGSAKANVKAITEWTGKYVQMRDQPRTAPTQLQGMAVPVPPAGTPVQATMLWWLGAFRGAAMKVFGG